LADHHSATVQVLLQMTECFSTSDDTPAAEGHPKLKKSTDTYQFS